MKIGLVTDSTSDLPSEIVNKYEIEVIPLNVQLEGETYKDGVDIGTEEFYRKQEQAEKLPGTSQPSVGEFLEKYKEIKDDYDRIISIHLSDEISGTLESARLAAEQISDVEIDLYDSRAASLGLGLQVVLAARLRENDFSAEEILDRLDRARENTVIYFTVGELTYLKEGGRIGKARAFLGSMLNFNPILEFNTNSGLIESHSKARGSTRTRKKMEQLIKQKIEENQTPMWLGFMNGNAGERYNKFTTSITDFVDEEFGKNKDEVEIFHADLGPVIGSHVGPLVYSGVIMWGDFLLP